jgi:hypothetical protein
LLAGEIGLHVEPRPICICFDEPQTDPCFSIGAHTRIARQDHCLGLPMDTWRRADFGFLVRMNSVWIVYVFDNLCDRIVYVFFYHPVDDYLESF